MDVWFPTAALALTYNQLGRLRRVFSADMAYKISSRLAVLSAADNLSLVPSAPPIGLRAFGTSRMRFGVAVSDTHYLIFLPVLAHARQGTHPGTELSRITAIEIQGVEQP